MSTLRKRPRPRPGALENDEEENHSDDGSTSMSMPPLPSPVPATGEDHEREAPCESDWGPTPPHVPSNGVAFVEKKKAPAPPIPIPPSATFEEMLYQLILFKSECGNCDVSREHAGHRNLGPWVDEVRRAHKAGRGPRCPTQEQFMALRTVGFRLSEKKAKKGPEMRFDEKLVELRAFKERHGHTSPPTQVTSLGRWVNAMRQAYKATKQGKRNVTGYILDRSRIDALDELGFDWTVKEQTSWEERFQELQQFRAVNEHTRVPQLLPENKGLGKWVTKQRYLHSLRLREGAEHEGPTGASLALNVNATSTQLTDDRIAMLNGIGFEWSVGKKRERQAGSTITNNTAHEPKTNEVIKITTVKPENYQPQENESPATLNTSSFPF